MDEYKSTYSPRRTAVVVVLLALAVAHVGLTRWSWREIPLQTDAGIWSYIGWRLDEGRRLYSDLWESKPPGIYWVFATCVGAGGAGSDRAAFWLDAAVSVALVAVAWRLARRFADPLPAACAALAASLVCCHRILADWGCNTEKFVALFEGLALLAALRAVDRRAVGGWVVSGVCAGVAGCFKQTAILYPLAAVLYLVMGRMKAGESRRLRVQCAIGLVAGAAVVWIPVLAFLARRGELAGFWRLAVLYDVQRATPDGEASRLFSMGHWSDVGRQVRNACILLLPAVIGIRAWRQLDDAERARLPRGMGLLMLTGGLQALTFLVAPYGYGHYLLQLIPVATVLAALAVQLALSKAAMPQGRRFAWLFAGGMVAAGLTLADHFRFTVDPNCPARRAYAIQREVVDAWRTRIAADTKPGESVMIWPPDYPLSYYAQRPTPLEISNADVITQGKAYRLDPPFETLFAHIRADEPRMIVDRTRLQAEPTADGRWKIVVSDGGISLDPALADPRLPQVKLASRLLTWIREHYGGQTPAGDGVGLYPGRPWRGIAEMLRQR